MKTYDVIAETIDINQIKTKEIDHLYLGNDLRFDSFTRQPSLEGSYELLVEPTTHSYTNLATRCPGKFLSFLIFY